MTSSWLSFDVELTHFPRQNGRHFADDIFIHSPKKSLATLDGEIVDPAITAKLEMQDVLKVHDAQT